MIKNISRKIIKHNNDYSKLESLFFTAGYGHLVIEPYESLKIPYRGKPVTISILIPCHNSVKTIKQCLQHIADNSYVIKYPDSVEVIVIDDGSLDKTYETLRNVPYPMNVLVIKQDQRYRSGALNTALYHAHNDFILTCDSDICLDPDCIEEAAKRLQILGEKALLVGFRDNVASKQLLQKAVTRPHFWADNRFCFDFNLLEPENMFALTNGYKNFGHNKQIYINSKNGINRDIWTLPRMVYGCLFACDKKFFYTVGGYNENFCGWGFEDTLIGALAIAMKKYIIPIPSMCGFHISHPVDANVIKNTPNRALYNDYILAPKYDCHDYINESIRYVKDKYECRFIKPKKTHIRYPHKTNDYYFYLGQYNSVKSGQNLVKSMFLGGKHEQLLQQFPTSIYACFIDIIQQNLDRAVQRYHSSHSKEKAYLQTVDPGKLIDTAYLRYNQGSVLLAFMYFSLYGLIKGFDTTLKRQLQQCGQEILKKSKNEISWCTRTF